MSIFKFISCLSIAITLSILQSVNASEFKQLKSFKHQKRQTNKKLRSIIQANSFAVNYIKDRAVPSINSPTAQLGKHLFFSKALGGDYDSACVSCHHPMLGGSDDLSLPIGVEADDPDLIGPGRTNNNSLGFAPVPRNAPTTFNTALWDSVLFHDGRLESLDKIKGANGAGSSGIRSPDTELGAADPLAGINLVHAQARFPVTSNEEMKGFDHSHYTNQMIRELLAGRLGGYGDDAKDIYNIDYWIKKFTEAYPGLKDKPVEQLINEKTVFYAIAEYERSQVFINSPWMRYLQGNKRALPKAAKKGAILFFTSKEIGGANCSSCHSGDTFTDEQFHNLAMPQIGPGKESGANSSKDFGRARESGMEKDKFAFRTPSLLNVEVTGPWTHAGAYTSLQNVIKHHVNAKQAIEDYDFHQLDQLGILNLDKMKENTVEALNSENFALQTIELTDKQIGYLVEFLKSLTDPCTKNRECMSPWIVEEDYGIEHQLNAIDRQGYPL